MVTLRIRHCLSLLMSGGANPQVPQVQGVFGWRDIQENLMMIPLLCQKMSEQVTSLMTMKIQDISFIPHMPKYHFPQDIS